MQYNLYFIVKNVIKSKNPKEYVKKIKNKKFVYGFYLIEKIHLIKILKKSVSVESKLLLKNIQEDKQTGYELCEKDLEKKQKDNNSKYFDNNKQIINYENIQIKYLYDDNTNLFFRAKDVCSALGYNNNRQAIASNINKKNCFSFQSLNISNTITLNSKSMLEDDKTTFINESGLYELFLNSKKKSAKQIAYWIAEEVLPLIRKHGFSVMNNTLNLDEYHMKNCFYIFRGYNNLFYKYGITQNIKNRMKAHKSEGLLSNISMINHIFVLDNYNQLMEIENKIKQFIKNEGHKYKLKKYDELFKKTSYSIILEKIKSLVSGNIYTEEKNTELTSKLEYIQAQYKNLKLQNETAKIQNETAKIQNENLKIENENLKLMLKDTKKENKQNVKKDNKQNVKKDEQNIKINIKQNDKKDNKKKKKLFERCIDCKVIVFKTSERCSKCNYKVRFEKACIGRPSYEQLLEDLKELGAYTAVGRKYDVSDNTIRKWIKKYKQYQKKLIY